MGSTHTAATDHETPGLVSGKLIVVASVVVFAVIGVAFWAAGKWFSANPIEAADTLDYANRAEWVVMPATTILLTEPPRYMRGPYGSKIKEELPFTLTAADEELLRQSQSELTAQDRLDYIWSGHPERWNQASPSTSFYFDWLRTQVHEWPELHRQSAIDGAPAILALRYVTPDGQPLVGAIVGDMELTFARKADGVLDDSLRLLYPNNRTDQFGRVYLPVFDTPLQVSVKPDPPGYKATYPFSGWLIFPGKVGGPDPIVVRPKTD